jgi:hypothetical protein
LAQQKNQQALPSPDFPCLSDNLDGLLGNPDRSAEEQVQRLRVFLSAYGSSPSEAEVIGSALDRQSILIAEGTRDGNTAMSDWADNCRRWTLQHLPTMAGLKCQT